MENSLNLSHSNDDFFLSLDALIYENLKDSYNDKYEYILPEVVFDKNLLQDEKFGILDLQEQFEN